MEQHTSVKDRHYLPYTSLLPRAIRNFYAISGGVNRKWVSAFRRRKVPVRRLRFGGRVTLPIRLPSGYCPEVNPSESWCGILLLGWNCYG